MKPGPDGKGVVLDVAVEGGQDGAMDIFAVPEIDGPLLLGDGHVDDIVVLVESEVRDGAAALCGSGFKHFEQFCPFHVG